MIKILMLTAGVVIAGAVLLVLAGRAASSTLTRDQAAAKIRAILSAVVRKNKNITGALVLVDTGPAGVRQTFTAGTVHGRPMKPDQPFHVASVGKSFTAALVGIMADEGWLNLDDPVDTYLPPPLLEGLFTVGGVDYSKEVTIAQLLNHTSGVADYFYGPVIQGTPLIKQMLSAPDRFWTPADLVEYTRVQQKPAGKPREKYSYSDTGYILLGLLLEKVSGKTFHELLHERIFTPLGMDDSYLLFYSNPVNKTRPLAEVWLNKEDLSRRTSLSIDWAGGGIVSTLFDLEKFIKVFARGEVVKPETRKRLWTFDQKFRPGIHYGLGFMEFHFGEFFPTLKSFPVLKGHMGVLGTQMLYDEATGTVYIAGFGSASYSAGSVRTMIKILATARRVGG